MQRKRAIHRQMFIRIVTTVTIAITIIMMFSYEAISSTVQAHVQQNMRSQVQMVTNELEAIIRQQKALVNTYADMIKGAYKYDWKYTSLEGMTKVFTQQSNLHVFGFWFIAQSDYQNQGEFVVWYGMEKDGSLTDYSDQVNVDVSLAEYKLDPAYSYYHAAIRNQEDYITYPYRDPYLDIPMLSITAPVYDDQGGAIGVAGIDIRFQDIQQAIALSEEKLNGTFLITNRLGELVSDVVDNSEVQIETIPLNREQIAAEVRYAMAGGDQSQAIYRELNETLIYVLPIEELAWIAVMLIPSDSMDNILVRVMNILFISLAVTIVVTIAFVHIWVNRLITKPLLELVSMTKRISTGDYSQQVIMQADNEWKLLGDHMNQMLVTLQHQASIEHEMKRISALKVVGEMAAAISHEIRNPLTTVRGFLQLMRSKPEHVQERVYFDTMIEEILRANAIITEYLTLAQNKYTEFKPQSLNDIIERIFPLVEAAATASSQHIKTDLQPISIFPMHQKEMRQLLHNLIRNGLEAMALNEVLYIRTWQVQNKVILEVEDSGEGFDPAILQLAGTPFMTNKQNGTGLGLAICYSIVHRHKGSITIYSRRGCTIIHIEFLIDSEL